MVQQRLVEERARQVPTSAAPPPPTPPIAAPPAISAGGMTEESVLHLMSRERMFTHATLGVQITPPQLLRMEQAYRAEKPQDVAAWTTAYIADMGFSRAGSAPAAPHALSGSNLTTAASAAPAPAAPSLNISDKGPAAGGDVRDAEAIYDARPLDATRDDFERLVTKHGRGKALELVMAKTNQFLRTLKVATGARRGV